jgi:hypothetical protein
MWPPPGRFVRPWLPAGPSNRRHSIRRPFPYLPPMMPTFGRSYNSHLCCTLPALISSPAAFPELCPHFHASPQILSKSPKIVIEPENGLKKLLIELINLPVDRKFRRNVHKWPLPGQFRPNSSPLGHIAYSFPFKIEQIKRKN